MSYDEQVDSALHEFERETRSSVTPRARDLIRTIINSIVDDPHPSWKVKEADLDGYAKRYVKRLPEDLRKVWMAAGKPSHLTCWTVLHYFDGRLVAMCFIPK